LSPTNYTLVCGSQTINLTHQFAKNSKRETSYQRIN
jgi:hypothetical protein